MLSFLQDYIEFRSILDSFRPSDGCRNVLAGHVHCITGQDDQGVEQEQSTGKFQIGWGRCLVSRF